MQMHTLANFGSFFGVDGIVLLVLGLLIFGKRLPEVGKNLGQTIVQFKRGLNGKVDDEQAPEQPVEERPVKQVQARVLPSSGNRTTKALPTTEEV